MENIFGSSIIPQNEEERLDNLKKYKILYTQSEPVFDQIAASAATILVVPVAMINFVDKNNVWTKALKDSKPQSKEVERGSSLCSLAILSDHVTVIEDFKLAPSLLSNPLIAGESGFQFYAAAPIKTSEGFNIGVVCILDQEPRKFTTEDRHKLESIADSIRIEIEGRL